MGKSMDWFLDDRVLRRKELKSNVWIKQTSMPITKFYSFAFNLIKYNVKLLYGQPYLEPSQTKSKIDIFAKTPN